MLAAAREEIVFPLAALPLTKNSHLGFDASEQQLHRVIELANSLNASGLARSLYDERRRSRGTGKERDQETGLDYFGARYYGSALGRFTSPDPLAGIDPYDPQSWNAYAYGRNNPLSYVDPTGESYQICDANGQNCTDKKNELTDDEFASEKKAGQANGEVFSNGTFSHTDAKRKHGCRWYIPADRCRYRRKCRRQSTRCATNWCNIRSR